MNGQKQPYEVPEVLIVALDLESAVLNASGGDYPGWNDTDM